MDLGKTIAVFITIATILIFLFCLLIRYFSQKLKNQRKKAVEINQIDQPLCRSNQEIVQGAYQQFLARRQINRSLQMKEMSNDSNNLIENASHHQIIDISNNIYGMTRLRKSLQNAIIPLQSQTNRSALSMKQFNISRLNTNQTQQAQYYHYVNKLVLYNLNGLFTIQVLVKNISRKNGQAQLKKEIQQNHISYQSQQFIDQIENHGFQINVFGCYKYISSIDITNLKEKEIHEWKNLKINILKQPISQQQFSRQKEKMFVGSK